MKKLIIVALLSLLVLSACDTVGTLFNPVIGTWEIAFLGVTTEDVFHTNGDCSETVTVGGIGATKNGSWSSDGATLSRVWEDDSTDSYSYSFNSSKSEMTLSPTAGGMSLTFSRM